MQGARCAIDSNASHGMNALYRECTESIWYHVGYSSSLTARNDAMDISHAWQIIALFAVPLISRKIDEVSYHLRECFNLVYEALGLITVSEMPNTKLC